MLVVALVADVDADVVQQRRVFQPLALAIGQAVDGARLVEQREREPRDLLRVLRPVVAALGELDDAAAPDVGIAIGLRDLLAVPRDVVEHQPFAQRQIAQRDLARRRAAGGSCRAGSAPATARSARRGSRPGHAAAASRGRATSASLRTRRSCLAETRRLRSAAPAGAIPARPRRDRAEAENRARRADDAIEAGPHDLLEVLVDLGVDVPDQLPLVARRRADRSCTKRSVSRMTPSLKLRPSSIVGAGAARDLDAAAADVDDDRARRPATPTPYTAARWISRASSVPEMTRGADAGLARDRAARNSPPFSASRVALVATAMISSTRCDSASRLNFDSTCSAACMASGVSARPSRPPAPRRTISFSRSMTSNDRSGRTCTTIMWRELVPMSMAAMRIWSLPTIMAPGSLPSTIMPVIARRYDLLRNAPDRFTRMLHGRRARGRPRAASDPRGVAASPRDAARPAARCRRRAQARATAAEGHAAAGRGSRARRAAAS